MSVYYTDNKLTDNIASSLTLTYETIQKKLTPLAIEFVFNTNMACIRCYDWISHKRKLNSVVDYSLSQIENGVLAVYSYIALFARYFAYNSVELHHYPWMNVSRYYRSNAYRAPYVNRTFNTPLIEDVYSTPKELAFPDAFSETYRSCAEGTTIPNQTLITMATGNCRIVALWNPDRPDFIPTMEKSRIDFILVEYGHPKMKGLIQIQLPDSIYMVGNEILSKAFVLRHLNNSCLPNTWYFDEDYLIRIIDHNADSIEIGSDQYIVLEKDGYQVAEDPYANLPDLIPVDSIEQFMCTDSENESQVGYMLEEDDIESELEHLSPLDTVDSTETRSEEPFPMLRSDSTLELSDSTPDSTPLKKTYSISDTVFVLDDFVDDSYTTLNKIEAFHTKPKTD
jgi:hypothetical protein